MIIWSHAYVTGSKWYNEYINLGTVSVQAGMVKTGGVESSPTPPIGSKEWIRVEWEKAGAKWEEVYAIMQCESNWNNNLFGVNTNGSIDLGIYMINSVHIKSGKITLKNATDPIESTYWAINLYKEQGWAPWVCSRKLGIN